MNMSNFIYLLSSKQLYLISKKRKILLENINNKRINIEDNKSRLVDLAYVFLN